jgi:hypothetical protein
MDRREVGCVSAPQEERPAGEPPLLRIAEDYHDEIQTETCESDHPVFTQ